MLRPSRDEVLMQSAENWASRSTCCRAKVGAVIAREGRIISTGYVGAPSGQPHCTPETCNESQPCTRTLHAEANAIIWAARKGIATECATLYTTVSPCPICADIIANAGIVRVIYKERYRLIKGIFQLERNGVLTEQISYGQL